MRGVEGWRGGACLDRELTAALRQLTRFCDDGWPKIDLSALQS